MTHKASVLQRHPKAICYMSQLSGMFFVKSKGRRANHESIIAYQPTAEKAWKQAHLNPKKRR